MATAAALTVALRAKTAAFDRAMNRSGKKVNQFSTVAKKAGAALGIYFGGRALYGVVEKSVLAFAKFEHQMALVHTMLDEGTSKHLPKYTKQVRKMAMAYGESTDALSKGLYDILSAGIDAADAMYVLEVATRAAVGGATDAAVAVDGLTSLLNAYQMSASRAGYVSDIMFATVRRGKITFAELAANVGKVAPMARAAGMPIETMAAAIATLTRQGLSAEEATTRLNAIMKVLPNEVNNLHAAMMRFKGRSLASIIGEIPNVRAAAGIAALSSDIKGLTEDLRIMADVVGEGDAAFEKMYNKQGMRIKRMKSWWSDLLLRMGEKVAAFSMGRYWARLVVLVEQKLSGVYGYMDPGVRRLADWADKPDVARRAEYSATVAEQAATKAEQAATKAEQAAAAEKARVREVEIARLLKIEKSYDAITKSLKQQIDLHGKNERAAVLYSLVQKGASQKQLDSIREMIKELKVLDDAKRDAAAVTRGEEAYIKMYNDLVKEIDRLEGTAAEKRFWRIFDLKNLDIAADKIKEILALQDKLFAARKAATAQERADDKTESDVRRIFEQTRTALEIYNRQITKLDKLLKDGAINWDTYGRAVRQAISRRDADVRYPGDPGEFRQIDTSLIDIRGLRGTDPAAARDEERNRMLAEQLAIARRMLEKEGVK